MGEEQPPPAQPQPRRPAKQKPQNLKELLFDSGQTVIGIIIILLVALLAWEVSQLMGKVDPNTQSGQAIVTAVITGVIGLANAVVGFYFGSRSQQQPAPPGS